MTQLPPANYVLTFSDDFSGDTVDSTKWLTQYRWGQTNKPDYTVAEPYNISIDNSVVSLTANDNPVVYNSDTYNYSNAVLSCVYQQMFGYYETRMKCAYGKGLISSFWLLKCVPPDTFINEIDIAENLAGTFTNDQYKIRTNLHWGSSYASQQEDKYKYNSKGAVDYTADFHTFGLLWETNLIQWFIDGQLIREYSGDGIPQVEMNAILDISIGNFGVMPDSSTIFPNSLHVDYVKIYSSQ